MKTLNNLPTGKKKEEPGRRVKRLAAEVSLGLIGLFLLIISRRFNWRENLILLILSLGLFRAWFPLRAKVRKKEFHSVVFVLLFFVTWKLAQPLQANPLCCLTLAFFGFAAICFWWDDPGSRNRLDLRRQLSQRLAVGGVVVLIVSIFLFLKILGGDKYGTPVSPFILVVILFLFVGSYLISASPGKRKPFSRPVYLIWVLAPLIVVGVNTSRGLAAWRITRSARTLNREGDQRGALASYRQAERINSSLGILPIQREWLLAEAREQEKLGSGDEAISFYQRAVDAGTRDPVILLHLGELYLREDRTEKAFRIYLAAGEGADHDLEVRKELVDKFIELKRYPEAVEQLEHLSPGQEVPIAGVEQNLGLARVYQRQGDLENAAVYLDDAFQYCGLRGENNRIKGEINYALGTIYQQLGDFSLAEKYLRQALNSRPSIPASHFLLGQIYEESDSPAAVREYRQLVTKLPNHIDGLKRLRELLKREENIREGDPSLKSLDSRIAALTPSIQLEASLENEVMFLGYDLSPVVLKRGEPFTITYYWKGLKIMSRDYRVYVHFDNALHTRVRFQYDHEPLRGNKPTSTWEPGCVIQEQYDLVVPEDVPPESYLLRVGMFDARGDKRNLKPIDSTGKINWGLICQDNTNRLKVGSVIIE